MESYRSKEVRPYARTIEPLPPRLRPFVDEEQRDHEALIGRWFLRLLPVALVAYVAWALVRGSL